MTAKVSGFRAIWHNLDRKQRKELQKALDVPAPSSLTRWIDDPGSMRTEVCQKVLEFLEPIHPGISVKDLTVMR